MVGSMHRIITAHALCWAGLARVSSSRWQLPCLSDAPPVAPSARLTACIPKPACLALGYTSVSNSCSSTMRVTSCLQPRSSTRHTLSESGPLKASDSLNVSCMEQWSDGTWKAV